MKALEALEAALGTLRERGSPLLLLRERSFDAATAAQEGDYDLLAPAAGFDATILAFVESLLATRTSVQVHAVRPEKRLIVLHDEAVDATISIDLWREHRIDVPVDGKRTTRLLLHDALKPFCEMRGPVLRMQGWLEVAVYLCHLFEKKKDLRSSGVQGRLAHYGGLELVSDQCPPELLDRLRLAPRELSAAKLDVVSAAKLGCEVLESLGLLGGRPALVESTRWKWRRKRRSLARRLGAGPVVTFQGPDGSGKTTLIGDRPLFGCAKRPLHRVVFKRLYRRSIFRWLYKLVRKLRRLRDRDEQKEVVEVALSPFLFVGALINYRLLRLFCARGKMLWIDRFFSDLLVTNRKTDGADLAFTRAARNLERLVPHIDCAVLLAASAEVLRARKAEMSDANTQLYLSLMCQHYVRRPPDHLLVLRTDVTLERSLAILEKALERIR